MLFGVIWCDSRGRRFFGAYGADIGRTELVFARIDSWDSGLSIRAKTSSG